jgi:adenylyltransferase/sulfurtransferase
MRYSRQEKILDNLSNNKIKFNSKIVVIGCGGVGSVLCELLVRGGFNNLVLIDNDLIDETNLGRQNFEERNLGDFKAKSLRERLVKINSKFDCKIILDIVQKDNISEICKESNLIIDCSDNFETRKIINEYCELENKDWIYSGAVKTEIITCIFYGKDKLFSKVFSQDIIDESCCDVGVLASTTFSAGSLVYNQVLKYFLEIKEYKLIKLDLWANKLHEVSIK